MTLTLLRKLFVHFIIFLTLGCGLATTRPKLEMSLAASAFLAAKKAHAPTLAPTLFRKAEIYFIKAKSSYRRKYFNKAKQYADLSRDFAEKAEFIAIKKSSLEGVSAGEPEESGGASGPPAAPPAEGPPAE